MDNGPLSPPPTSKQSDLSSFGPLQQKMLSVMEKYVDLTDEERHLLTKDVEIQTLKKGTVLLDQGNIANQCYFVLEGLVRQFEVVDGEERTTDFYTELQAVVAFESAANNTKASFSWICEEDCTLVIGNEEREERAYEQVPKLETMGRLFMGEYFGKYQNLAASFITMTPEERYLKIQEERPDLVNRVRQYHLANYLGIKPESLSRIRKRIVEKMKTQPA